jgi:hypothetical protein
MAGDQGENPREGLFAMSFVRDRLLGLGAR